MCVRSEERRGFQEETDGTRQMARRHDRRASARIRSDRGLRARRGGAGGAPDRGPAHRRRSRLRPSRRRPGDRGVRPDRRRPAERPARLGARRLAREAGVPVPARSGHPPGRHPEPPRR
ncbi:hypothetical protein C5C71_15680 [Rathayibacter sp. AY1C1]|nr:hypothetical protein C5C71_15680 [Rathayibacter sp. AY1C1]